MILPGFAVWKISWRIIRISCGERMEKAGDNHKETSRSAEGTRRMSILLRTALFTGVVIFLTLGLFVVLIVPYQKHIHEEEIASRAEAVATSIAQVTATAIISGDYSFVIDHCIQVMKERPSILYIVIARKDGFSITIANGQWKKMQLGGFWVKPSPSHISGRIMESDLAGKSVFHLSYPFKFTIDWGWIHIGLSLDKYRKDVHSIYTRTFLIFIVCLLGGVLLSFYFARRLSAPIMILNRVTRRIREGDLSARAEIETGDEVESLADSFNEMTETLQSSQRQLRDARDRLELRVDERTAELLKSNELLMTEIADRQRAEELLKESEERYRKLLGNMPDPIFTIDLTGNFNYANPACMRLTGYSMDRILSLNMFEVAAPEFHDFIKEKMRARLEGGAVTFAPYIVEILDASGKRLTVRLHTTPLFDEKGRLTGIQGIASDITLQRNLEKQLLHAQKMESIGTLAGGVAHDFNNLLTAILGNLDLSKMEVPPDHPIRPMLEIMEDAGARAKDLIKQLLQFGRPAPREVKVISLSSILEETSRFLRPLIPSTIEIEKNLPESSSLIKAEPSSIAQIIANLSINARDAMPGGGRLRFEIHNESIDDDFCKSHIEAKPGSYCVLTVADTGVGMKAEVRERIFEPFFTTKERGSGTGLGLSMVYGAMKQSDGWIQVYSEVGKGTVFKLYFPLVGGLADTVEKKVVEIRRGTETVLLADDETMIVNLGRKILEKFGYTVIIAADAREAITLFLENRESVDLVILDLTMPEGGGIRALKEIRALSREIPIIISSGYLADTCLDDVQEQISAFLDKPFSAYKMVNTVREALDGMTRGAPEQNSSMTNSREGC
jgi:PAS domain S-box-containing protein